MPEFQLPWAPVSLSTPQAHITVQNSVVAELRKPYKAELEALASETKRLQVRLETPTREGSHRYWSPPQQPGLRPPSPRLPLCWSGACIARLGAPAPATDRSPPPPLPQAELDSRALLPEIPVLMDELKQTREERDRLTEELAAAKENASKLKDDLDVAEKYIASSDEKKEELAQVRAKAKIDSLTGEKERLLAELTAARSAAIETAAKHGAEISAAQADIEERESEITRLRAELTVMKEESLAMAQGSGSLVSVLRNEARARAKKRGRAGSVLFPKAPSLPAVPIMRLIICTFSHNLTPHRFCLATASDRHPRGVEQAVRHRRGGEDPGPRGARRERHRETLPQQRGASAPSLLCATRTRVSKIIHQRLPPALTFLAPPSPTRRRRLRWRARRSRRRSASQRWSRSTRRRLRS